MASIERLNLIKHVNIAYYLRVAPLKFHIIKKDNIVTFKNTSVLDNTLDEILYYIVTSGNIIGRLCVLIIGTWFQVTQKPTITETCTFYLVAAAEITSLSIQIANLAFLEKTLVLAESFNVFERKLIKHAKIDQKKKDGAEIYLKGFIILCTLTMAGAFPTCFIANYFGYQVFEYISKGSVELSFTLTVFMSFGFFTDFILIYHYVGCAIVYAVVSARFYKLCSWKEGLLPAVKYERLNMFRGLQLYNRYVFHEAHLKTCVIWCMVMGCALMILPTFALISYWEHLAVWYLLLFSSVALISMLTTKAILKLMNDMVDLSAEFIKSYKVDGKANLTKYEELCFNCCTPNVMPIGSFEKIRKETFPYLMQDIVLSVVVDLVLATRGAK